MSAEPATLPQRRPARRSVVFLKTLLVFVLLGPPVGWLFFATSFFVFLHSKDASLDDIAKFGALFVVGLPLSFILGGVPAVIAGVTAGIVRARPRPPSIVAPAAVAIACALAFALLFDRSESSAQMMPVWQYSGLKALTCLLPFMLCWWLTRRFQMEPDP